MIISRIDNQTNIQAGFSRLFAREFKKLAPTAPSTSLWSQLKPKVRVSPDNYFTTVIYHRLFN